MSDSQGSDTQSSSPEGCTHPEVSPITQKQPQPTPLSNLHLQSSHKAIVHFVQSKPQKSLVLSECLCKLPRFFTFPGRSRRNPCPCSQPASLRRWPQHGAGGLGHDHLRGPPHSPNPGESRLGGAFSKFTGKSTQCSETPAPEKRLQSTGLGFSTRSRPHAPLQPPGRADTPLEPAFPGRGASHGTLHLVPRGRFTERDVLARDGVRVLQASDQHGAQDTAPAATGPAEATPARKRSPSEVVAPRRRFSRTPVASQRSLRTGRSHPK